MDVSSAKSLELNEIPMEKLFTWMKIKEVQKLSVEELQYLLEFSKTSDHLGQFYNIDWQENHSFKFPDIPLLYDLYVKPSFHTLLKDFEISRKTHLTSQSSSCD